MKYKELPKCEIIDKLESIAFDLPSKNRRVYKWCEAIRELLNYTEHERVKLVKKYGEQNENGDWNVTNEENIKEFFDEWELILDSEILDDIPNLNLMEDDFDDEKCSYPKEKEKWLSPLEIGYVCKFK